MIQSYWIGLNEILVAGTKGEGKGVDKSQVEGKCRDMSLSQPEIKGITVNVVSRRATFSLTADF